ncbi:MAG: hypothetical protein IJ180_00580 [Bacteroidales bacterium]|nr:hypothetical protein [Bacteroidales bacterium]
MGTSYEILKQRITVANFQISYLKGCLYTYISERRQREIEDDLKKIEDDYYKPEEDEE